MQVRYAGTPSFPIPGNKGQPAAIHIRPVDAAAGSSEDSGEIASLSQAVEVLEKQMIEEALRKNGGNQRKTAKTLGVTERILGYKLKSYGLSCPR